jgi:diguanylate cyclase (GGDEF)-like protein
VDGDSEFSALAAAFNTMSTHIKKQLNTLQSFSKIDREIISKIDIEQITELVINRMQTLKPDAIILIANVENQSVNQLQCNCTVAKNRIFNTLRLSLTPGEVNDISLHQQGQITRSSHTSLLAHSRLLAEMGADHLWVYPVFWQGSICAFVAIGSQAWLTEDDPNWSEFRDLASRVGIAIATHEREQKLLLEAQYDGLTGLPNRILLQDRLKLAMEHSAYTGKAMWVVFIDLDRFKVVNDSMGHSVGDELLKEIGRRLMEETRDSDTVARFGGDEFIVLLRDIDIDTKRSQQQIQLVAAKIAQELSRPFPLNDNSMHQGACSIGLVLFKGDTDCDELLRRADTAMYQAKRSGQNQPCWYSSAQ